MRPPFGYPKQRRTWRAPRHFFIPYGVISKRTLNFSMRFGRGTVDCFIFWGWRYPLSKREYEWLCQE